MVRRFHRSIYDELDELRASMDYLYQLALEPADTPLLPGNEHPEIICQYLHNLNAEVAEHDDEVTITLDTVPDTGKVRISLDLIDECTLEVTSERDDERTMEDDRNFLCERTSFTLHQLVPLPAPVLKAGARMGMSHGVLDLHLKKARALHTGKS
jgi:HSP20 family molecular chaperone IbpA